MKELIGRNYPINAKFIVEKNPFKKKMIPPKKSLQNLKVF